MTGDKQKLELAKWLFERTLGWIASSDVKVGVALALDTALIGGLAAAFVASEPASRMWWCYPFIVLTTIGLVAAMFCAGMAAIPRMLGPVHSMIYFGRIAERTESVFVEEFSKTSEKAFLDDIVTQIYRNSQIASAKHLWVRASMKWLFFSLVPWLVSIAMLVKK